MYSEGYKYWLAYKTNSISYYRCFRHTSSKCPGRCINEDGKIRLTAAHNHPPEFDKVLVDKFRKTLTYRAAKEKTELYAIYCDEATTRHSDAAMLYPFNSAESAMRKARRTKQLPQITNSIDDIINILNESISSTSATGSSSRCGDLFRVHSGSNRDSIYQKTYHLNDSICMIFMHRKTFELFDNRIDEILLDGQFEFVPDIPPNYHLLTLHAIKGDITAPIVYALLTAKTQSAYSTFFAYLREELHIIPNTIICDFDHLMQTSLAYTFPEAIIKGCWYHYTDAVLIKMKSLGLQRETTKGIGASGLRMLLVLPLLPAEYMSPGLESIRKWLKEKNVYTDSFALLCDYIENNWLRTVGAEKMSIFGTTKILLNHTRNFNKELLGIIDEQNPIIWVILESITQLATKIYVKIHKKVKLIKSSSQTIPKNPSCARSQNQIFLSSSSLTSSKIRPQKKNELVTETIISSATQLWIKTPVHLRNPLQFLQLSSHCINDSIYLSVLSDVKEKILSSSIKNSTPNMDVIHQQITNCWSQTQDIQQQQQQLQHQHHQSSIQQQEQQHNQLETDLTDLSTSVNFLEQATGNCDYDACTLEHEFMLAQPQNQYLNIETIDNQNSFSYFTSCSLLNLPTPSSESSITTTTTTLPPPQLSETSLPPPHQQQYDQIVQSTSSSSSSYPMLSQSSKSQHFVLSSNPPPLAFFPSVKRLPCKRRLPILSEPPPLVPIQSKICTSKQS